MRVVKDGAQRSGKKAMVAFNLTGELDQMKRRHDLVLAEGGSCVMASLNSIGLVGLVAAATFAAVGSTDLIFAAGGGIFGHPGGVAAGVSALRHA